MSRTVRMLLASALGALGLWAMAGLAHAATPFTAGTGGNANVAVGSDGTGHVVWATPNPTSVGYCRVSAGAETCNRTDLLGFGAATNAQTTGRPTVFTPAPNKVVVVAGCWNCPGAGPSTMDRTYRWISTDNGVSFGPPAEIGQRLGNHGTGTWLDDEGIFVGVSSSRVRAADLTGADGVEYAPGGVFVYGPQVTRVPDTNKLVAVTNDLYVVKYGVYTGPLSVAAINTVGNWDINKLLPGAEGDNSATAVNSGPSGVYMTYRYFIPNDNRLGLRRFDPATNTFGPPTYIEGEDAIDNHGVDYPDSFQDASGRLHAVWRSLYGGGRLRYRVSDPSGGTFSAAANLAAQESFYEPELAAGADGKGFAVWTNGTVGNVRIVPIDPLPEPVVSPPPPGGGTTPPPGGGLPIGPTFKPRISLSGPGNSATAKIVGRRIKVRMRGAITLPAGADRAIACKGKIRLKIKKGKRTMANRKAKLKFKRGKCRFAKTIVLKRSKVGKTRALRLKVRFRGNTVLKAGSASKTLVIKK